MAEDQSSIAFLGLVERAECIFEHPFDVYKWNILGLRTILGSPIYPFTLTGYHIAVALHVGTIEAEHLLLIETDRGDPVGTISISTSLVAPEDAHELQQKAELIDKTQRVTSITPAGWHFAAIPLGNTSISIPAPGIYNVLKSLGGSKVVIGQLIFAQINPPPFTAEQLVAIKSDPHAAKALRMELGCTKCPSKMRIYVALEKPIYEPKEGFIWYQDVPDTFVCDCGSTRLSMASIKRNFFSLLGRPTKASSEGAEIVPLYGQQIVLNLRQQFLSLLSRPETIEEHVQKFIEANPLILHQFPASKILWKPPFLNSYSADIAVLSPNRELLLIELENPSLRLLNRDGGVSAKLQHPIDQVNSWIDLFQDHKLAILSDLRIGSDEVTSVRGLVIAGRDKEWNPTHLRRLKGRLSRTGIGFLTFDDLAASLYDLSSRIGHL
jgi:hypothetical protein